MCKYRYRSLDARRFLPPCLPCGRTSKSRFTARVARITPASRINAIVSKGPETVVPAARDARRTTRYSIMPLAHKRVPDGMKRARIRTAERLPQPIDGGAEGPGEWRHLRDAGLAPPAVITRESPYRINNHSRQLGRDCLFASRGMAPSEKFSPRRINRLGSLARSHEEQTPLQLDSSRIRSAVTDGIQRRVIFACELPLRASPIDRSIRSLLAVSVPRKPTRRRRHLAPLSRRPSRSPFIFNEPLLTREESTGVDWHNANWRANPIQSRPDITPREKLTNSFGNRDW